MSVGPVELRRIAVRRTNHDMENLALADLASVDLKILARRANATLGRRFEAQEFLGREVDQVRIRKQSCQLVGKLMQPPQRHGDGTARGATARCRHHIAGRENFEIAQPVAAGVGLHHGADHIRAGLAAALLDHRHEVVLLGVENVALLLRHRFLVRSDRLKQEV